MRKCKLKPTIHRNLYDHGVNEPGHKNEDFDYAIYCRRENAIVLPLVEMCDDCPFFSGMESGHGVTCTWDDTQGGEKIIRHDDVINECNRVDKLIKDGVLKDYSNPALKEAAEDATEDENPGIMVMLAMSDEQAEKENTVNGLVDLPESKLAYENLDKVPDELCLTKIIGWERVICAYKKDFELVWNCLFGPDCAIDPFILEQFEHIEGDKFWLYGYGN